MDVCMIGVINSFLWNRHVIVYPYSGFPLTIVILSLFLNYDLFPESVKTRDFRVSEVFNITICVDALQYITHRLSHKIFYHSHSKHHVYKEPSPHDAFKTGMIDAVFQLILPIIMTIYYIKPVRGSLIIFGLVYSIWLQFIHSNIAFKSSILVSPCFHKTHHRIPNKNFGHVLTIWDHLFCTAHISENSQSFPFESHPTVKKIFSKHPRIPKSCIGIHGVIYDIRDFHHPGGQFWIHMCDGTDVTILFETMHLNNKLALKALNTLDKKGTYREKYNFDFTSYRRVAEKVLHAFPSRTSRIQTSLFSNKFTIYVILCGISMILLAYTSHVWWFGTCILNGVLNAIIGGYGHNYLHRLDFRALALDWNGLSSFEWFFEHIMSHHPYPNTEDDHDSVSMLPFVSWLNPSFKNIIIFPIFCIGEIIVTLQGYIGHRCRWKVPDGTPVWMIFAPWLFVLRFCVHIILNGVLIGTVGLMISMIVASFHFSLLAHLNHAPNTKETQDFMLYQLQSTRDLITPFIFPDIYLGLDRQTLHHLFPSIDHSHLDTDVRCIVQKCAGEKYLHQYSMFSLFKVLLLRLFV